jgi:hypothetical protein
MKNKFIAQLVSFFSTLSVPITDSLDSLNYKIEPNDWFYSIITLLHIKSIFFLYFEIQSHFVLLGRVVTSTFFFIILTEYTTNITKKSLKR